MTQSFTMTQSDALIVEQKNTDRQVDPKDASASKNNKCILPCDYGDL